MKNTQAYVAATPVALFIVIESVAVLFLDPQLPFGLRAHSLWLRSPCWSQSSFMTP